MGESFFAPRRTSPGIRHRPSMRGGGRPVRRLAWHRGMRTRPSSRRLLMRRLGGTVSTLCEIPGQLDSQVPSAPRERDLTTSRTPHIENALVMPPWVKAPARAPHAIADRHPGGSMVALRASGQMRRAAAQSPEVAYEPLTGRQTQRTLGDPFAPPSVGAVALLGQQLLAHREDRLDAVVDPA